MSVISVNDKNTTATLETLSGAGIPCAPGIQWVPDPEIISELSRLRSISVSIKKVPADSAFGFKWTQAQLGKPGTVTLLNGKSVWKFDWKIPLLTPLPLPTPVKITKENGVPAFRMWGRRRSTYQREIQNI